MDPERKKNIRASLNQVHTWPSLYMYKFIVPTASGKYESVVSLFPKEADILTKESSSGKYTSLTIKLVMMSAEEVMVKHEEVSKIEGVISL